MAQLLLRLSRCASSKKSDPDLQRSLENFSFDLFKTKANNYDRRGRQHFSHAFPFKMAHMNNKTHPRARLVHEGSWGGASDPLPPVSRLRGQWRRTVAKGPASHGFVVFSRAVAKSDYVIERGVTIYGLTG